MNKLHEVLEICLEEIEKGADIDTVLFRYPELAAELRPILEASAGAKAMAVATPSPEVVRRNRARLLQQAAEMRESKRSARRFWFASARRVAVTLTVVAALFISGTGLVRAASTTVPGDNLYPVKRTWEDVLLLFTFNLQQREALEVEHKNERLHELQEVFAEGRSTEVEFTGVVTSQNGNEWLVSGIPVVISAQTEIRGQEIVIGSAVEVEGHTQGNLAVLAEKIELLPPGAALPDIDDNKFEIEEEDHEGRDQKSEEVAGEKPKVEDTETPESDSNHEDDSSKDGSDSSDDDSSSDDHSSGEENSYAGGDDSGGDNHDSVEDGDD